MSDLPPLPGLTFDAARHAYAWRGQRVRPTVTEAVGQLAKPGLVRWAARTVADAAIARLPELAARIALDGPVILSGELAGLPEAVRDAGAARGTAVHAAMQALANGWPIEDAAPDAQPYVDALVAWWVVAEPDVQLVEARLLGGSADEPTYAGSLDLIARARDGACLLIDAKTSRTVDAIGWRLQLAGYADAAGTAGPHDAELSPLPTIDRCAVLHITPAGARLLPMEVAERERTGWRALLALYHATHATKGVTT
jgi:hypothetical protein